MQPDRTTNHGGRTMGMKVTAPRCQLLLILLMSAVMLLPGTNGSLLLVQRTVTRTIVLQETIGKEKKILKDLEPKQDINKLLLWKKYSDKSSANKIENSCYPEYLVILYPSVVFDAVED
ncbi:hypothetical protein STEG23_031997 [Scotinomys teguina]